MKHGRKENGRLDLYLTGAVEEEEEEDGCQRKGIPLFSSARRRCGS